MTSIAARHLILAAVFSVLPIQTIAQEARDPALPHILDMRERAAIRDAWLEQRLDTLVPELMAREGVDMWLLIGREYNEDPVLETMLPATWISARRRTILLFSRGDDGSVERLSVSRYPVGDIFAQAWTPEEEPDQWARLAELVDERDPETIAVNRSETFPLADGLTASEADALEAALGERYAGRLVSGEALAVGWLETRSRAEITVYRQIVRIAHAIIAEGFSEAVITPGVTTTQDVAWWFRDRVRALGLQSWFHPSVSIQRNSTTGETDDAMAAFENAFLSDSADRILPGDLLHVDFGIMYLGLATDTQHHGYVLRPGETEAPAGLRAGLAQANRLQDILLESFEAGAPGNAVLAAARETALEAGLTPSIYTHPIGYHGHGAGAAIGMWDNQGDVPGTGDYPVNPDTAWSIELNIETTIPDWDGQTVLFKLEEDAVFDGERVRFLDGRQDRLHLVPRP